MQVIEISSRQARRLILTEHYAHRMPTIQKCFGLVERGDLVGVVAFGQPASPYVKVSMFGREYQGEIMELSRLVIITKTRNAASFLIGQALRRIGNIPIVSYADQGAGHVGYVYQATNWHYSGSSKPRTDIDSGGKHARHHGGDPSKRQYRSAKHRYWFCRDKQLNQQCRWGKLPYPKGDTVRH